MILHLPYILFIAFSLFHSFAAQAVQKFHADPETVIEVTASFNDANIISITGGAIESVWGTEGKVILEADVDAGHALFRPVSERPFTLFVQSEAGNTYTLSVKVHKNLIGQSILLNEFGQQNDSLNRSLKAVAFKTRVKRILRDLESSTGLKSLMGFNLKMINREIPLWRETRILFAASWRQSGLIVGRYVLTNVSNEPLRIEERELRSLSTNVRAISIRKHILDPAESTVFYLFETGGRS